VPTLGEFLPGYEADARIRYRRSQRYVHEVISKRNKEINARLTDPKISTRIADLASTPFVTSPAELDKLVIEHTERCGKVIRAAHWNDRRLPAHICRAHLPLDPFVVDTAPTARVLTPAASRYLSAFAGRRGRKARL
jgi:hypothetical protein